MNEPAELDALVAAGKEGEAIALAEKAVHSARAHNWLGCHLAKGKSKEDLLPALRHLEAASRLGGWWGVAHLNHADVLERLGRVDEAYVAYGNALMSGDSHDPALAHARRSAIDARRGLLRHALSSIRRAIYREERDPRDRRGDWRKTEKRLQRELRKKGVDFPDAATERKWIEREIATKREGLGVDRDKPSRADREWLEYEDACALDVPATGPLAEVEKLLRNGHYDRALAELATIRERQPALLVDAIAFTSRFGERAARQGDLEHGRALLGFAVEGYEVYASWATSGAEGHSRMGDVENMKARVAKICADSR